MAVSAYGVIREAMKDAGRIALGRVVMHTRERLVALEPRGKGILAYSLRMRNEVVDIERAFESIPDEKLDKRMIDIAEQIIEQQEGEFAPAEFRDRYEEALRELIERKERGEKTTVAAPPPDTSNVIDLMEALKKSLGKKGAAASPKAAAGGKAKKKSAR
jgi:DNA end-binding protein Ku